MFYQAEELLKRESVSRGYEQDLVYARRDLAEAKAAVEEARVQLDGMDPYDQTPERKEAVDLLRDRKEGIFKFDNRVRAKEARLEAELALLLEQRKRAAALYGKAAAMVHGEQPGLCEKLYNARAHCLSLLEETERSYLDCDRCCYIDPRNAVYYYNRGCKQREMGRLERAEADLLKACKLKKGYRDAVHELRTVHEQVAEGKNQATQKVRAKLAAAAACACAAGAAGPGADAAPAGAGPGQGDPGAAAGRQRA